MSTIGGRNWSPGLVLIVGVVVLGLAVALGVFIHLQLRDPGPPEGLPRALAIPALYATTGLLAIIGVLQRRPAIVVAATSMILPHRQGPKKPKLPQRAAKTDPTTSPSRSAVKALSRLSTKRGHTYCASPNIRRGSGRPRKVPNAVRVTVSAVLRSRFCIVRDTTAPPPAERDVALARGNG
jgi:hypothetical protein